MGHNNKNYSKYSENFQNNKTNESVEKIIDLTDTEKLNESEIKETVLTGDENWEVAKPEVENNNLEYIDVTTQNILSVGKVIKAKKLYVREKPNKESNQLNIINENDIVKIDLFNSENEFYKIITMSGLEGYCMKEFIELIKDEG